jgi:hypothetical protein
MVRTSSAFGVVNTILAGVALHLTVDRHLSPLEIDAISGSSA